MGLATVLLGVVELAGQPLFQYSNWDAPFWVGGAGAGVVLDVGLAVWAFLIPGLRRFAYVGGAGVHKAPGTIRLTGMLDLLVLPLSWYWKQHPTLRLVTVDRIVLGSGGWVAFGLWAGGLGYGGFAGRLLL